MNNNTLAIIIVGAVGIVAIIGAITTANENIANQLAIVGGSSVTGIVGYLSARKELIMEETSNVEQE